MGPRHRGHSPVLASSGCTRVWRERTPTGDLDPGSWSGNRRILVPASTLAADTQVSNWPVSTPPGLGGAGLRGHPSPGASKTDIPDTGAATRSSVLIGCICCEAHRGSPHGQTEAVDFTGRDSTSWNLTARAKILSERTGLRPLAVDGN